MKKIFSVFVLASFILFAQAQTTTSAPETLVNGVERVVLDAFGNGSTNTTLQIQPGTANKIQQIAVLPSGTSTAAFLNFYNSSDRFNGGFARLGVRNNYAILSYANQGTPAQPLTNFGIELDPNNAQTGETFVVSANGQLSQGSPTILLKVNAAGVETIEAKVRATVTPPDYVFSTDYKLPSLEEVEAYVKANKHLPEIPSAAEFEANGIQLGKMSFDLLKKVEELTLYMIELKKENETLKARVEALEK